MALKPKPGAKPAAKTAAVASTAETATSSGRTVTLERSFSIQTGDGQWAKAAVAVTGAVDDVEEIREQVSELASAEVAAAIDQLQEFTFGAEAATDEGDEGAAEDDTDEGAAEGDDEDIGPDQINAMKRPELLKLIDDNGLSIDPDDHPSNPKGLKTLRAAIIEEAFAGDDGDGDEAGDEDGSDDGDASDDGEEITVEDVKAMDRPTLIELIESNELPINHAKLTKLVDLRKAVIAAMEDDGDDAGDDAAASDDGEEGYDEDALQAMGLADLKAIYTEWDLGKFPTGSPIAQKKLAVKAILKAQEG